MADAHDVGSAQALFDLGLSKIAANSFSALEELAKPSFLNKIESLLIPTFREPKAPGPAPQPVIDRERAYLKKRYNISPQLTGSMPLGLNIPGDVDIDLFVRAESPKKFKNTVRKLRQNPRYVQSPFDKPDTGYYVFRRLAENENDYPVDLAVAFGDPAKEYQASIKVQKSLAKTLPEDLRKKLVAKKYILKNTPFDAFNHKRYRDWKRSLETALGGGFRLDRAEVDALKKVAAVVDLDDKKQLDKFRRFTGYKDMYGHRTHNLDSVLEGKGLMSALEALKRGKLRSFEAGSSVGTHKKVQYNDLSQTQLGKIEKAMLTSSPNTDVFEDIADTTGRTEDAVKADFIRQDFTKIKQFLKEQANPEEFRKDHFSISKLGPNIFVTKGGILDEDSYGDSAVLARSRTATKSPFMNLVTDEFIVPAKDVFEPRKLRIGSGYVLAPKAKIKALDAAHPKVKFVATEDIPDDIKDKLYKPTHSLKEVWQRWVPSALSGDLSVRQTH